MVFLQSSGLMAFSPRQTPGFTSFEATDTLQSFWQPLKQHLRSPGQSLSLLHMSPFLLHNFLFSSTIGHLPGLFTLTGKAQTFPQPNWQHFWLSWHSPSDWHASRDRMQRIGGLLCQGQRPGFTNQFKNQKFNVRNEKEHCHYISFSTNIPFGLLMIWLTGTSVSHEHTKKINLYCLFISISAICLTSSNQE